MQMAECLRDGRRLSAVGTDFPGAAGIPPANEGKSSDARGTNPLRGISSPTANNPFTDVEEGKFYYNAVLWAVEQGITNGTTPTTFAPDATCTRGQIVTFLYRFAGEPAAVGADIPGAAGIPPADDGTRGGSDPRIASQNPFTDVAKGKYYYDAVLWAVEQGITNGTTPTAFSPDKTCTRGEVVTFLYRAR